MHTLRKTAKSTAFDNATERDMTTTGGRGTEKNGAEREVPQEALLEGKALFLPALLFATILFGQVLSGCTLSRAPDIPERGPFGGLETLGGRTELEDHGDVPGGWTLRPVSETASSEASGESIRFEELQDGPVVVNKWATWCPPCVEEIGSLQSLHGRSREETSIVLVSEEDVETVRRFVEKRGVSVPMYVTDEMPAALEGKTIPRTYVVKADREVVYRHVGAADWSADRVYRFLGRLGASPVEDASGTD